MGESKTEMRHFWMGRDIEEMSKDELRDALIALSTQMEALRLSHAKDESLRGYGYCEMH